MCSWSAVNIIDLRSYALQNLVGTHRCSTFLPAAHLPPLPLATFVRATRLPSTLPTCICTHCKTLLLPAAEVHSYVLLVCHLHRRPAFVCVAEAHWYALLSYIRTCCSYAVNTTDLHSYALQNLVGTHGCPTFVYAARRPPLPLATFVRATCLPSTSSACLRTCCRTLLVHTAVQHSYRLRVCCHYRWLHSYVLLVCRQHRRPAFVCVAEARWYALLSYIRMRSSYAVNTTDLCSYALQNLVGTHRCCTFVHVARLLPLPLATFVRATCLQSTSSTCIRTRCKTSLVSTAVLHSYVLLVCCLHRQPAFVRISEARLYVLLSYIRTRCSYAVNTADLRSDALQNLVGMQGCPTFIYATHLLPLPLSTFIRAPRLLSTSSTCVRTYCRTSFVHTTVVHTYTQHVRHHYRRLHSYVLLVCC